MLYIVGKYIFLISYYFTGNGQFLVSMYSLYDLTKFTFYVSNNIGVVDYIKNYIIGKNTEQLILMFESHKCELVNPDNMDIPVGPYTFSDDEDYIEITKL